MPESDPRMDRVSVYVDVARHGESGMGYRIVRYKIQIPRFALEKMGVNESQAVLKAIDSGLSRWQGIEMTKLDEYDL